MFLLIKLSGNQLISKSWDKRNMSHTCIFFSCSDYNYFSVILSLFMNLLNIILLLFLTNDDFDNLNITYKVMDIYINHYKIQLAKTNIIIFGILYQKIKLRAYVNISEYNQNLGIISTNN